MLIPSSMTASITSCPSLSRRVNANSQLEVQIPFLQTKLIKKGEC